MTRLAALLVLSASPALASESPAPIAELEPQFADGEMAPTSEIGPRRGYFMEIGFRSRYVFVPDSILDIWYFNEDDPGWALPGQKRPDMRGYALGLEYVVKGDSANGIFYFEYINSLMKEGYWDDVEEPADHGDGDYLVPTDGLGLLTFGADYAYELHFVTTAQTNGQFGLSFLVGGGLGVAAMLGHLDRWGPAGGVPAYVRHEADPDNPDEEKRIPKVYPMVDINAGLRFNFGDRVVLRVEGGLHDLLYMGGSLGLMF
ncbi:MAG: hypothetical protein EP330_03235 [Deltaproteobacteria bacterium]|nr:MAG: hypothetical protein EP330_03235 [Deltaproteobacteria bacterium]